MITIAAAAVLALAGWVPTVSAQAPRVNANAQVLQDYKQRVDKYVELHKRLEKLAPPMKRTDDPAKIKASQDGLAAAIRRERATAKQGEIFTPEIAQLLRQLMYPEVKGQQGAEVKKAIKEDAPAPATVSVKVNARYPDSAPLPTVPPALLASLPQLPEELEYRIIGRDLLLRDVHANLIVDVLTNAIR